MDLIIQLISGLFLLCGSFFCISGGVGIIRFPDFYTRMHAVGVTDTLAAAMILFGLMLQSPNADVTIKLTMILLLTLFINPAASHALAKSAIRNQCMPLVQDTAEKPGSRIIDILINIILLAFLVAVAIAVVRMKDLLSVIMLTGIYGLLSASFFVALDAVDVAFTEASVGAGISTLLMLVVISNTGRREHPTRHKPLLALITVLITGALLVYGTFDMPYFGFADAPAHQHVAPRYIEDSLRETGLINIVTSVLASYRAFDTFGEVVVIFTAGIAVLAMLSFSQPAASDSEIDAINQSMHEQNLILRIVTKMLLPFIMLYALYVQFHGDFGPGGGFQAGVIFAAGIILYSLLFGLRTTRKVISESFIRLLAAFGILLYGSVGIYSLLTGRNYFDYNVLSSDPVAGQHLGILLIELGVGLTVASVMIMIFFTFFGRGRIPHSPSKALAKEN